MDDMIDVDDVDDVDGADRSAERLGELRVSARGWHGVQLAVLGFIGLCGVLQGSGGADNPRWLQVLSGTLVLTALGTACVATVLVALAAWPVYGPDQGDDVGPADLHRTSRSLRLGIGLTFLAVVLLAVGTSSAWWPSRPADAPGTAAVQVTTRAGSVCGELEPSTGQGRLAVSAGGQRLELALTDVVSLRPVGRC